MTTTQDLERMADALLEADDAGAALDELLNAVRTACETGITADVDALHARHERERSQPMHGSVWALPMDVSSQPETAAHNGETRAWREHARRDAQRQASRHRHANYLTYETALYSRTAAVYYSKRPHEFTLLAHDAAEYHYTGSTGERRVPKRARGGQVRQGNAPRQTADEKRQAAAERQRLYRARRKCDACVADGREWCKVHAGS